MIERSERNNGGRSIGGAAALTALVLSVALWVVGCGQEQELVCTGPDTHMVLVPSTSETDFDVSKELAPEVSRQVVRRVAQSCGRITVGIQDGRPAANLVLRSKKLVPDAEKAYNPGAETDDLVDAGSDFVESNLIEPLEAYEASGGSPFFSTMIKIGEEVAAHDWPQPTIVLVGDGLVVERTPQSGEMIRFGVEPISSETLAEFVPLLKPLEGACVLLLGAGATSKLPEDQIRASQELMEETLEKTGVGFVPTRSPELPEGC